MGHRPHIHAQVTLRDPRRNAAWRSATGDQCRRAGAPDPALDRRHDTCPERPLDARLGASYAQPGPVAPQRRGVQFAAGVQRLFDEMFNRVALIDDHVPLILLDHLLDLRRLMTRHDGKAVPLATNTLVLLERH